jgi:hypothetical protein
MAPRILSCCLAALALAGCGAEKEPSAPSDAPATELTVRVDPDGDGPEPAKESRVRDAAGLRPADLEPVPDDLGCAAVFDGPQTATVSGTLEGRRVDARFNRTNGCEIERWEKAAPLLETAG